MALSLRPKSTFISSSAAATESTREDDGPKPQAGAKSGEATNLEHEGIATRVKKEGDVIMQAISKPSSGQEDPANATLPPQNVESTLRTEAMASEEISTEIGVAIASVQESSLAIVAESASSQAMGMGIAQRSAEASEAQLTAQMSAEYNLRSEDAEEYEAINPEFALFVDDESEDSSEDCNLAKDGEEEEL